MSSVKNNAQGIYREWELNDGVQLLLFSNDSPKSQVYRREIHNHYIQFHFAIKGQAFFQFNEGDYQLPLNEEHSLLLYNPNFDLPLHLILPSESWLATVLLPIKSLHSLFSKQAHYISFLSDENKGRKYYKDEVISPAMSIVLNQLMQMNLHDMVQNLYVQAKVYELLCLYFNATQKKGVDQCPFLADEENVVKIRKAKEIIIERLVDPPTLKELAEEVDLSINKLKDGFKQIYGEPVFSFQFDYKMELARQLLASGSLNVNEVGLRVGYSTASHFIAAFKKKYGVTPKKFVMGMSA